MSISETGNNLLDSLRARELALLRPHLEDWRGGAGQVIYEPGDEVTHAYFPCGASLVCFVVTLDDGHAVEAAMVGREGVVGGIINEGGVPAYSRVKVQSEGRFLRIRGDVLDKTRMASQPIRTLLSRYSDCLLAQVFQSVACNASHTIYQRTARWLLAAQERTGRSELFVTQDELAAMLGVGRSYLSRVAHAFKSSGMIETRRGSIAICDEMALRRAACKCDDDIVQHFRTALDGVYPD